MYAVFDVETTGLCNRDRVVEIAIAQVDQDGKVTDRWETLVNPQRDLGPQELHGIRSADVRRAPTFDKVAAAIVDRIEGRIPVAHNLAFDARLLTHEYLRLGTEIPNLSDVGLCTMRWAGHFLPGSGRSLHDCCRAAEISLDRPHEAMSDVLATCDLLALYLGSTGAVPPWAELRDIADRLTWPALRGVPAEPVFRGAGASDSGDYLSRLVDHLPRVQDPPEADTYLALLDRALADRFISATESDQLVELASELGIDRRIALELHAEYMVALAEAALEDGEVSAEERGDLEQVARLLSLPSKAVDEALERASAMGETSSSLVPFALEPGASVVLTGSFPESKPYWAARVESSGYTVAANVTKKTALVIAADPDSMSGKAEKARRYGIPVVGTEAIDRICSRRRLRS